MQWRTDTGQGQYPIADFQIKYFHESCGAAVGSEGYLLHSWQCAKAQTANPEPEYDLQCSCFTATHLSVAGTVG